MKKFANVLLAITAVLVAAPAFAEEAAAAASTGGGITNIGLAFLALGVAAIGGALGQGKVGAAALEGIARNPQAADKIFTPMILALAFIESLVIYALVIALIK